MNIIKSLFLIASIVSVCIAQNINISGIVKNNAGAVMEGASVKLEKAGITTTTLADGSFKLSGMPGSIHYKNPGQLSDRKIFTLSNGQLHFSLKAHSVVKLDIYNIRGSIIYSLRKAISEGPHSFSLPGSVTGINIFKVKIGNIEHIFKIAVSGKISNISSVVNGNTGALSKQAKTTEVIDDVIVVTKTGYLTYRMNVKNSDTSGVEIIIEPGSNTDSTGNNAQLSNISLSTGTLSPPFSPQVSAYKVNLDLEVTSITITGTAADLSAKISEPVTLNNLEPNVTQAVTIVITAENGDKREYKIEVTRGVPVETIEQARQRWMDAYISGADALIGMYTTDNALLLSPSLKPYKGISEIKTYWDENHIQSSKIESFKTLYVNTKRINTSFEIGTYVLDGKLYQYAVVWRINNKKWYRKVDAFNLKVTDTDISSEINNAEKQWEAAFNSGNAKTLSEVYIEDGILFHNISFYTGRSEIEKFWKPAMSRSIILSPLYSVSVNENLAYQFGTYVMDKGEPFLLIWVKQNGKWLVKLDAWKI